MAKIVAQMVDDFYREYPALADRVTFHIFLKDQPKKNIVTHSEQEGVRTFSTSIDENDVTNRKSCMPRIEIAEDGTFECIGADVYLSHIEANRDFVLTGQVMDFDPPAYVHELEQEGLFYHETAHALIMIQALNPFYDARWDIKPDRKEF